MTTEPTPEEIAALGIGAQLVLSHADRDYEHVAAVINADPGAATYALLLLAGALATDAYGERAREALHTIAIAADLSAIERQAAG
ncbi:hypothetical protein [Micromonospora tulbaghiae]|uniref:hypothetical protein n=1 Tax=Micromonospora tulbaghiae TaxID=479978 RepID=UPI003404A211